MVDFAITAERGEGMAPEDAIRRACLLRFRPIMMTTMAALLGALPLALGHGTGSELRQPLGVTMVGGLIFSQAMTLFTTPVVYLYLDRLPIATRARPPRARPRRRWRPALAAGGADATQSDAHEPRQPNRHDDRHRTGAIRGAEPEGAA